MIARIPVHELEGKWRSARMDEQPRAVILDPSRRARLRKLLNRVSRQEAKSPWIFCREDTERSDDRCVPLKTYDGRFRWEDILSTLSSKGVNSVMIEGGAIVINDILSRRMADVIIIAVSPVIIGRDGVGILPALQNEWLQDVQSIALGKDVVVAGRIRT